MSFTKVNYVDNETIITADNLNDIQDAIVANEENIVDNLNTVNETKVSKSGDTMTGSLTTPWLKINTPESNKYPGISFQYNGTNVGGLNINATANRAYITQHAQDTEYNEQYYFPTNDTGLTTSKTYSIATSKNYSEVVYLARGNLLNAQDNNCTGFGIATVFVNYFTGKVRIDFSITISDAGSGSTYFLYGLNRDLLTNANNQIPTITPISGGTVSYYTSAGALNTSLNGYGGYMSVNNQFWTPCRVYSNTDPNAVGQWPSSQMTANLRLIGTYYGILA